MNVEAKDVEFESYLNEFGSICWKDRDLIPIAEKYLQDCQPLVRLEVWTLRSVPQIGSVVAVGASTRNLEAVGAAKKKRFEDCWCSTIRWRCVRDISGRRMISRIKKGTGMKDLENEKAF